VADNKDTPTERILSYRFQGPGLHTGELQIVWNGQREGSGGKEGVFTVPT
jgi:hypothetical protein